MLKLKKQIICKQGSYLSVFIFLLVLFSCSTPKDITYFQDVEGYVVNDSLLNFEPKIQVDDLLLINVSALESEAALPFNLYETPPLGNSISNAKPLTYLVNVDGAIDFPVLGKLQVKGLTTRELNVKLVTILNSYIKNPIVNIRLTNFEVTVTGEVSRPGVFNITNERVSILDALSLAGDMTIYGNRKTVLLIREQNGKRIFVTLDLTNKKIFNSPYFYLVQNDALYVEPNKTKKKNSAIGSSTSIILSSLSILISLVSILI